MKVVIGLLTYRRPQMLRRALESLRHLNIPDSVSVAAVVIDNNPDRSALPIVAAWAAGSGVGSARGAGMPLTAVHEPRRGIASARNRLIEAALERGADAIAFFDDDEILHPDWLAHLLDARAAFGADVVAGPVHPCLPPDAPAWTRRLFRAKPKPTGTVLRSVATSNVLFSTRLVDEWRLRFDERLNLAGSEDVAFFEEAGRRGARMVWAADARVDETVHPERLTRRAVFLRSYGGASGHVRAFLLRHGRARALARYLPRAAEKLLAAVLILPRFALAPQDWTARLLSHAGTGFGILGGLGALVHERYRVTQGH